MLVLAEFHQLSSPMQPSSAVKTVVSVPTQRRVTRQLVQNLPSCIALRQTTTHTRSGEQQKLQTAQKYRSVSANSVLRGEMELLELDFVAFVDVGNR